MVGVEVMAVVMVSNGKHGKSKNNCSPYVSEREAWHYFMNFRDGPRKCAFGSVPLC